MTARKVKVHVLYGIPCVGKSTAAIELAHREGIRTVIHTDYIREVQRAFVAPESSPALAKVTHNAWELYGSPTRRNIAAGFADHVDAVAPSVRIVVRKLVRDGLDAVIEGAHFNGLLIDELRTANALADLEPRLLIVPTGYELWQRIRAKESKRVRGAERKSWRENIPVMLAIQDVLISDARTHGIQIATLDEWRCM